MDIEFCPEDNLRRERDDRARARCRARAGARARTRAREGRKENWKVRRERAKEGGKEKRKERKKERKPVLVELSIKNSKLGATTKYRTLDLNLIKMLHNETDPGSLRAI